MSKGRVFHSVSVLALAVCTSVVARSQSTGSVPPQVRTEINKGCEKPPVLEPGFLTERDINGDGVPDYILDYGRYQCGGDSLLYCGSAGCLTQVFASLPDGRYAKVLDENVRGLAFRKIKGRPAMIIDLHGSACGRAGAAACNVTLFWNGRIFSPAN